MKIVVLSGLLILLYVTTTTARKILHINNKHLNYCLIHYSETCWPAQGFEFTSTLTATNCKCRDLPKVTKIETAIYLQLPDIHRQNCTVKIQTYCCKQKSKKGSFNVELQIKFLVLCNRCFFYPNFQFLPISIIHPTITSGFILINSKTFKIKKIKLKKKLSYYCDCTKVKLTPTCRK